MSNRLKIYNFFILSILLYSCNSEVNPFAYQEDTHSRGKATIVVEESYKKLFDTSIYTFESHYPNAHVVAKYKSEADIINDFMDRKSETIVISRDFTAKEKKYLKSKKIEVRSDKIASDAVTIIVNPANKDTTLTLDQLKAILTGKQKNWTSSNAKITVVYDQQNSANFNYLRKFCGKEKMDSIVYAVKSNEEVINYVKQNPNSMGVIGSNWISDQDDFDVQTFLEGIKVVALAKDDKSLYFQPYAGVVHTKEYPLYRDIWVINKARKSGLETGFVYFMMGEIGQTIILKSGLVPENAPIRLIQFTEE